MALNTSRPLDWKRSILIPIPKKGSTKECANHRTIALISHASKVMIKILHSRRQPYVNQEFPDIQSGFRKGRHTRDQVANIYWIREKAREIQKNTYLCFTDYTKAFESVWFSQLVMSDSLGPRGLQQARIPFSSPTPITSSNSCPLMTSNYLNICCSLLLLLSIFHSVRVFPNVSVLHIKWPKSWSFSFSVSPSKGYPGLISFRIDWFDLLSLQMSLKSLLQHHSSKASILWCLGFYIVQLSHPYMTNGKTS